MLLIDHFEATALSDPTRPFLHFTADEADRDVRLTYGEADEKASNIAGWLLRSGFKKGSVVGLMMPNSPEWLLWYIACQKIGAIACGINTDLAPADIASNLKDAEAALIVVAPELKNKTNEVIRNLDNTPRIIDSKPAVERIGHVSRDPSLVEADLLAIIFTSGTTGRAKAVMIPNTFLIHGIAAYQEQLAFNAEDRIMVVTPLFHGAALNWAVTLTILSGGSLVLAPKFSASRFWDQAGRADITVLWTMGAIINILLLQPPSDAERRGTYHLRIVYGNAILHRWREVRDRWGAELYDGFGMTETPGTLTADDSRDLDEPYPCVGRAVRGVDLAVLDPETSTPLPPRQMGDLAVRFGQGFAGYRNNPEAFVESVRNGWFYTGDIAYLDESGRLFFVDRKKDLIRRGGENIAARQIEQCVMEHPEIAEAAAVGKPDPIYGETVTLFLVPKADGRTFGREEMRAFCADRLPHYMLPEEVLTVTAESLPRTPTGRIQKFRLKAALREKMKGRS